jgi:IMP dehydrogenase/GMP reductase
VPDEPTLGEVIRRFEDRFTDVRDDIQDLGKNLEKKVDQRIYDLRHDALAARVATLETLREKDAERIVATRRWLIGAVIVPLIGILLPVIILLLGAGS